MNLEQSLQQGSGGNINDVIHLKFAEKHREKTVTFDSVFKSLKSFSTIRLEILEMPSRTLLCYQLFPPTSMH
jgi:hypothetical protein